MTHRVGPKGQVVIPKALRTALGLEPGDEVDFALDGDQVVVRHRARSGTSLRGRFAGADLTGDLLADRAAERGRGPD
jgi:AbrB family looped-hinge helix DNA binding protein